MKKGVTTSTKKIIKLKMTCHKIDKVSNKAPSNVVFITSTGTSKGKNPTKNRENHYNIKIYKVPL
jgi:hypothetical protein